jgi:predicted acyltransferase
MVSNISPQNRAHALDALRGFAILTMVLSGVIPYGVLPNWMYHAQVPPPDHQFNPNLPGLTWVDLVFPFFLFALGAAILFALSRRIEKGVPYPKIVFGIFERGFLLGFFAIFLRHVRPHVINPVPTTTVWLIALLGFLLMFLIFTRLPKDWNHYLKWAVRIVGWL